MRNLGICFGAAVLDEKLVVGGGMFGSECTDFVECYDFFDKSWHTLPLMQTPRKSCGTIANG